MCARVGAERTVELLVGAQHVDERVRDILTRAAPQRGRIGAQADAGWRQAWTTSISSSTWSTGVCGSTP